MSAVVHALQLDGRGGATEVALGAEPAGDGFQWIHLDFTDEQAQHWLEQDSGIPRLVSDALMLTDTRPRTATIQSHMLVYLRGVNLNPGANPEDMISIRLWVEANRVISTQRRSLRAVTGILDALAAGQGPQTPGQLLAVLVDNLTWNMDESIARIEDRVTELESGVIRTANTVMRDNLIAVQRQAVTLARYLSPQREALISLQGDTTGVLDEQDRLVVREAAERLQRLLEDLNSAREHAWIAQEALVSKQNDQLNQRMYVLAVLTGIFLPVSFLTGLFGINVGGMPGVDSEKAFLYFAGSMLVIMLFVAFLMRRKHWL